MRKHRVDPRQGSEKYTLEGRQRLLWLSQQAADLRTLERIQYRDKDKRMNISKIREYIEEYIEYNKDKR